MTELDTDPKPAPAPAPAPSDDSQPAAPPRMFDVDTPVTTAPPDAAPDGPPAKGRMFDVDTPITTHQNAGTVLAPQGGLETDPARAARVLALQDASGGNLPSQFINAHLDEVQQALSQKGFDPQGYLKNSPVVKQWLAEDPARQSLMADDLPAIAHLEYLVRSDPQFHYQPDGSIIKNHGDGYGTVYANLNEFRYAIEGQEIAQQAYAEHIKNLPGATYVPGLTRLGLAAASALGAGIPGNEFAQNQQLLRDLSEVHNTPWLGAMTRWLGDATQGFAAGKSGFFTENETTRALQAATPPTLAGQTGDFAGGLFASAPLMLAGGPFGRAAVGLTRAAAYAKSFGALPAMWEVLEPSLGGTILREGAALTPGQAVAARPIQGMLEHFLAGAGGMQPFALQGAVDEANRTGSAGEGLAAWAAQSGITGLTGPVGASRLALRLLGNEDSRGAAQVILHQLGMGGLQGMGFTLAQAIQDHVSGVDPDALDWERLGPALATSGALQGIAGAIFSGPEASARWGRARRVVDGLGEHLPRVQEAMEGQDRLSQVMDTVAAMKAQALHQDSVEGLLGKLASSGSELRTLFVHPDAWDQHFAAPPARAAGAEDERPAAAEPQAEPEKGSAETAGKGLFGSTPREAAAYVLGDAGAYDKARAAGQMLEVPLERAARTLAGTPHQQWFEQEARLRADALSSREAQDLARALTGDIQREAAEPGTPEAAAQERFDTSAALVHEDIKRQFIEANEHEPVAEKHAAVATALLRTGAHKLGLDPWEHYQQTKLKVLQSLPQVLKMPVIRDRLDADLQRIKAGDIPSEKVAAGAEQAGADYAPIAAERGRLMTIRDQLLRLGANIEKESHASLKSRLLEHGQAYANEQAAGAAARHAAPSEPVDHEGKTPIHLADIPYAAGTSRDGSVVYIHKSIPQFLEIDGKRVNVWRLIARHELAEYKAMRAGATYGDAHNKALHTEDDQAEKEGLHHRDYEAAIKPYVDAARAEAKPEGIPLDLNEQPYRDMGEERLLANRSGPAASDEGQPLQQGATQRNLVLQHNLTAEDLQHAVKMGGLAAPSLAIARVEHPLTGYGEISLLAHPQFLEDRRAKAFDADVYSPRYPEVSYKIDYKKYQALMKSLGSAAKDLGSMGELGESELEHKGVEAFENSTTAKLAFLRSEGRDIAIAKEVEEGEPRDSPYYKARREIRDIFEQDPKLQERFRAWADKAFEEIKTGERVYAGQKAQGGARYLPHTLENVVKLMTKTVRDGEGGAFGGVGQVRALMAKQFRGMSKIQAARDRIIPDADMNKLKDEVNEEFFKLSDLLNDDARWRGGSGFQKLDRAIDMLKDLARGKISDFRSWFDEPSDDKLQAAREFLAKVRNLPTHYFETKVGRAMQLQEFHSAVVPKDTSQAILDRLAKHGLEVHTYARGDEADRARAIREAGEQGDLLFQQGEKGQPPRGEFLPKRLNPMGEHLIMLGQGKDRSTGFHELAHFALEYLHEIAARPDAPQELRDDLAKVREFLGLQEGQAIPRAAHEKWALTWEGYAMEGRAPSLALRGVFARLSQWIAEVWSRLKGDPRVNLNPQVREMIDRMLATNDELAAAKREIPSASAWPSREASGMNQEEWDSYQDRLRKSDEAAHAVLEREVMASMVRQESEAYHRERAKVHAAVQDKLAARPEWRALNVLQHGEVPPTFKLPPSGKYKLDAQELRDRYGADALKLLPGPQEGDEPKANRGPRVYAPDGVKLADAARDLEFPDAESLWQALINLPDHDQLVEAETNAEMQARGHTDPLQDGSIHERARQAIVNEYKLKALRSEAAALAKQLTKAASEAQIARGAEKKAEREQAKQARAEQAAELKEVRTQEQIAARAQAQVDREKEARKASDVSKARDDLIARIANSTRVLEPEEILAIAKATIRQTRIQDLAPAKYRRAMVEAGKTAATRIGEANVSDPITKAEKLALALKAKEREELNGRLYDLATDALAYSQKTLDYHRSFQELKKRARLGKAGGMSWAVSFTDPKTGKPTSIEFNSHDYHRTDLHDPKQQPAAQAERAALVEAAKRPGSEVKRTGPLEMIDQVHESIDLRRASMREIRRRENMRQYLDRQEKMGEPVQVPPELREDLGRRAWPTLTLEEQERVTDAVRNLERLANMRIEDFQRGRFASFEEKKNAFIISANANGPRTLFQGAPIPDLRWAPLDNVVSFAGRCQGSLRKTASLCREIDGFTDDGTAWQAWQLPQNEAFRVELEHQERITEAWVKSLKDWGKVKAFDLKLNHYRRAVPGIDKRYSRWEAIQMFKNWGNADNRDRLMQSEKLSEEQVIRVISTLLDKDDCDFAQRSLDLINSFWPEIKAKQERVTGIAPEKVEALPILLSLRDAEGKESAHVYKGGYYPIAYDQRTTIRDANAADEGGLLKSGAALYASTKRGHTEARVGMQAGTRIRLDPNVDAEHVNQVIHDLAFHETVLDANKFLRDRDIHDTIVRGWGESAYRQFQTQLRDVAGGMSSPKIGWDKIIEHVKQGANYASRAGNLGTAIQQVAGLPQVLVRVGPKHFAQAIAHMFYSPGRSENVLKWVDEKSTLMRNRSKLFDKNITDAQAGVSLRGPMRKLLDWSGYYFWTKAFQILDTHTWLASYLKYMDEHGGKADLTGEEIEKRAIQVADQTVNDVQGSGATHDLPAVMRVKGFSSIFTANMSWWLANYNLSAEAVNQIRRGGMWGALKGGSDLMILYGVQVALWSAVETALTGKDASDWDSPQAAAKRIGLDSAYTVMSSIPFVREFAQTVTEGKDYQGPFGLRAFNEIGEALKRSLYGKDTEKAARARDRAVGQALGAVLHLPIPVAMQIWEEINAAEDGSRTPGQTARGLLFGHQYPSTQ